MDDDNTMQLITSDDDEQYVLDSSTSTEIDSSKFEDFDSCDEISNDSRFEFIQQSKQNLIIPNLILANNVGFVWPQMMKMMKRRNGFIHVVVPELV